MAKLTHFNNVFALVLVGVTGLLWGLDGRGIISLAGEVKGVLTSVFVLVAQFYFRKAPNGETPPKP